MNIEVTSHPAKAIELSHRAAWDAAMAKFKDVKAQADHWDETVYYPVLRLAGGNVMLVPKELGKQSDRLDSEVGAAELALMKTPAPDLPALFWKLSQILVIADGEMPAFNEAYVRQTIVDLAHLLGKAES